MGNRSPTCCLGVVAALGDDDDDDDVDPVDSPAGALEVVPLGGFGGEAVTDEEEAVADEVSISTSAPMFTENAAAAATAADIFESNLRSVSAQLRASSKAAFRVASVTYSSTAFFMVGEGQ